MIPGIKPSAICRTLNAGFLLAVGMACRADTNFITAQAHFVTNQFEAYARVEPSPCCRCGSRKLEGGRLEIVPGTAVQAGQKLAELGGPEIQALLVQNETAVSSAQTNLLAAQKSLAIQQQQLFPSRDPPDDSSGRKCGGTSAGCVRYGAISTASLAADSNVEGARRRHGVRRECDGWQTCQPWRDNPHAATGGQVVAQSRLLRSGSAAIQIGMTGQFLPADGGKPIPVKVARSLAH